MSVVQAMAVGAACVDRIYHARVEPLTGTSNPAATQCFHGGVARNVAENLARLGIASGLCSVVGDDAAGDAIRAQLQRCGCETSGLRIAHGDSTGEYAAILTPSGELFAAASDMHVLESLREEDVRASVSRVRAGWLFVDANVRPALVALALCLRSNASWRLALDATSVEKARALPDDLTCVDLLFANESEARALGSRRARNTVISRGGAGVRVVAERESFEVSAMHARVVNVTGAGDALVAGTLAGLIRGASLREAIAAGVERATLAIASDATVAAT